MERVYIDWTVSNWITVVLMVIIAILFVNLFAVGYNYVAGGGAGAA